MGRLSAKKRKTLSILFDYEEVSEEVLRLVLGDSRYIRTMLNTLRDENYIKKSTVTIKNGDVKYKAKFMRLSQKTKLMLIPESGENNAGEDIERESAGKEEAESSEEYKEERKKEYSAEYAEDYQEDNSEEYQTEYAEDYQEDDPEYIEGYQTEYTEWNQEETQDGSDEEYQSKQREDSGETKWNGSSAYLERKMKIADTVLMCCVAGCVGYRRNGSSELYRLTDSTHGYSNVSPFAVMEQTEAQAESIVKEWEKSTFDYAQLMEIIKDSGIVFDIKHVRRYFRVTTEDANHWNFSSATGVLLGRYTPYILYHANGGSLPTSKNGEVNFSTLISMFLTQSGIYKKQSVQTQMKAIIFVNNKVDLRRLVRNLYQQNHKAYETFETAHVIPTTKEGAEFLRMEMAHQDIKAVVQRVFLQNGYQINQETETAYLFPLLDKKGRKLFYGLDMDFQNMRALYELAESSEQTNGCAFRVICEEWQEGYYSSILGREVSVIRVDLQQLLRSAKE